MGNALVFVCLFSARDSNPGWGDWSRSGGRFGVCAGFWFDCEHFPASDFAILATGLDAGQRLEQKKVLYLTVCGRRS